MDNRRRLRGERCWFCDGLRVPLYFTCQRHRDREDEARNECRSGRIVFLDGQGQPATEPHFIKYKAEGTE